MTPAEIAAACESAEPGQTRELLEAAYEAVFGIGPWSDQNVRSEIFINLLDCDAYLDAALMLVPEGMGWFIGWGQSRPDELMAGARLLRHAEFAGYDVNNDVIAEGEARTPALALLSAIMRAQP